jgi:hypothetical protein
LSGILDIAGKLWKLGRAAEDLFEAQKDLRASIRVIGDRLKSLEDRMTYLEANQGQVITEARAAASAASTAVAGGILAEAVTRLTRLEVRMEQLPPQSSAKNLGDPA